MKFFPFSLIFCVLFILSRNIYSDIIYLKDGRSREGVFISSDDKFLELDTFDRKIKIPLGDIKSVEVGFSGTPVCVLFPNKSAEICEYQLHSLSEERIILLGGNGFLEVSNFAPKDLSQILWKSTPKSRIIPFLKEGIYAEIQTRNHFHKGRITGLKKGEILLEEQGKLTKISESEIKSLKHKPLTSPLFSNLNHWLGITSYIIPGYYQYRQGEKLKGSTFMGVSFLALVGAASQYNQAKSLSKVNYNFYTVNNRFFLEQDSKSRKKSIQSQQNGNALIGLFFIIFFYHLWDIYNDTNSDYYSPEAKLQDKNHFPSTFISQWEILSDQQNEIFRFQLSF